MGDREKSILEVMAKENESVYQRIHMAIHDRGMPVQVDCEEDRALERRILSRYSGETAWEKYKGMALEIAKELKLPQDGGSIEYMRELVYMYGADH